MTMTHRRLISRLEYDLKHLIWRAEVHALSAGEILQRFEQIQREYQQITPASEHALLDRALDQWKDSIDHLVNSHHSLPRSAVAC